MSGGLLRGSPVHLRRHVLSPFSIPSTLKWVEGTFIEVNGNFCFALEVFCGTLRYKQNKIVKERQNGLG